MNVFMYMCILSLTHEFVILSYTPRSSFLFCSYSPMRFCTCFHIPDHSFPSPSLSHYLTADLLLLLSSTRVRNSMTNTPLPPPLFYRVFFSFLCLHKNKSFFFFKRIRLFFQLLWTEAALMLMAHIHQGKEVTFVYSWLPLGASKSINSTHLSVKRKRFSFDSHTIRHSNFSPFQWCQFKIITHSLQMLTFRTLRILPVFIQRDTHTNRELHNLLTCSTGITFTPLHYFSYKTT